MKALLWECDNAACGQRSLAELDCLPGDVEACWECRVGTAQVVVVDAKCEHCPEARAAACFGRYEDMEKGALACGTCCAHGCEDGHCDPIDAALWPSPAEA